jgi:hypothetical protein
MIKAHAVICERGPCPVPRRAGHRTTWTFASSSATVAFQVQQHHDTTTDSFSTARESACSPAQCAVSACRRSGPILSSASGAEKMKYSVS